MKFSTKQLEKMGELARDVFRNGPIEVDETNLHGGSTVCMKGTTKAGASRSATEILVSETGQSADLSTLTGITLRRAS